MVVSKIIKEREEKRESERNDKDSEKSDEINIDFDSLKIITHLLKVVENILSILKNAKFFVSNNFSFIEIEIYILIRIILNLFSTPKIWSCWACLCGWNGALDPVWSWGGLNGYRIL